MKTPICDFVKKYAESDHLRMHMPGHKGKNFIGVEGLDLTEITGADSLYQAEGIIRESEQNASKLFGAQTFYSTEGSSHVIRAMLFLATKWAKTNGRKPIVLAGRNAHKSFLNSAVTLDFEVQWLYPTKKSSYLSCAITFKDVENAIDNSSALPVAVYLTSPDYLGNTIDVKSISKVCKEKGVLLIVDNAHGAYTAFLTENEHPIFLGADMCSDSAHKTLSALTGGAYMHVNKSAPDFFKQNAKSALSLFGSTSPSYLVMQSLDMLNKYLSDGYEKKLNEFIEEVAGLKQRLIDTGYILVGNEKMKITIKTKPYGYVGSQLQRIMEEKGVVCEFSDNDYLVLMPSVETGKGGLEILFKALSSIPKKEQIKEEQFEIIKPEKVLSIKNAVFSSCEKVKVEDSIGRIYGDNVISCPPAVSILVAGERIDQSAIKIITYYGVKEISVVKD